MNSSVSSTPSLWMCCTMLDDLDRKWSTSRLLLDDVDWTQPDVMETVEQNHGPLVHQLDELVNATGLDTEDMN